MPARMKYSPLWFRGARTNAFFASLHLCAFALISLFAGTASHAENWPLWRGPTADGICTEKNLPTKWSATENLAWKTTLKGKGESTPIIWGDKIFITYQIGDNPKGLGPTSGGLNQDPAPNTGENAARLFVACFSRKDGSLVWENEVKTDSLVPTHQKHNMASPSCLTDGERVYSWFGSGQLSCYTLDGKTVWERDLAKEYGPIVIIWGPGSSPALYQDSLIMLCDHTRSAYILAVNKKTGENLWKIDRGKGARSYSTPYFVKVAGEDQMIVNAANRVEGLNPTTGAEIWRAKGILQVPVPSPIHSGDTLFTYGGYSSAPVMAVKLGGFGDVTETNVLWKKKNGGPYVPSLVTAGGYLYMINDDGIGTCFEGATGTEVWKERIGGNFSSSPVIADGKIYILSEDGETVVMDAAPKFNIISRNTVEEYALASIAISDGQIFFRTDQTLYCVAKKP